MKTMKVKLKKLIETMKVKDYVDEVPKDFTGIVEFNGIKYWYLNGLHHREDGPAIVYFDGTKSWFLNGTPHREDGPAIDYPNGIKRWYLNDEQVDKKIVELHYMLKYKRMIKA